MNLKDLAERIVWTFISAAGGTATGAAVFSLDLSVWEVAGLAGLGAVVNLVTLVARDRLAVLPSPGGGLPGLHT